VKPADVGLVSEPSAHAGREETVGERLELGPLAAVAGDEQAQPRPPGAERGAGADEQVESLLRLEPADRSDHDVTRCDAQFLSNRPLTRAIPAKGPRVDPVQDHTDAMRGHPAAQQLRPNLARD